jgi:hypothetical protein
MDAVDPAVLADAARGLRVVLAEIEDPDSELTASAVTHRRIEGAAVGLEVAAGQDSVSAR